MQSLFGLFKLAIANLRINKLRSGLTVLGMVFGTGAVIATLSSSAGAKEFVQSELKKLGVNTVTVRSVASTSMFDDTDAGLLKKYSRLIESVNLVLELGPSEVRNGSRVTATNLNGVQPQYFSSMKEVVKRGRLFDASENETTRFVAVLGYQVAKQLFKDDIPVSRIVHLYIGQTSFAFEVIGVLKEKGGQATAASDNGFFIPYRLAQKLAPDRASNTLLATLFDEETSLIAKPQISGLLKPRFPAGLQLIDAREAIERNREIWEKQNLVGILLALISLLTGGVGIMNIMLLSVSQRRKEIGLRKAVGANNLHILLQFLLEAVSVCIIGGILGVGIGVWFGQYVAKMMGQWNAVVSIWTILLAIGFAMLTGIVFGIFPALRASRLDPYEALRT